MRERQLIAFLTTVQFVHMVDFVMMMPMGPMLMRTFAIGSTEFAAMLSAYTFAAALAGVVSGFFVDRFDRRAVLMPLLLGFSLATMACAWAPTHHWMIAIRALAGLFGGVLGALIMSIVPDAIPPERRGRALGIVIASFSIASIVGIPIGMNLATTFSWHAPFLVLGVIGLGVLGWAWAAFPSMRGHVAAERPTHAQTLRAVFGQANHWRCFALTTMLMLAGFTVIPFISPYLVGNLGFRDDQLQYIYLTGGALTAVTSPLLGRLSDHWGAFRVFAVVAVVSVIPILWLTHLPAVGVPAALVVTSFFIVFVSGRFVPATTLIADGVEPRLRGSFMGFNSAVQLVASGAAALIAGAMVVKEADGRLLHYDRIGWLAAVCTVLMIGLAAIIRPAPRPPASTP